ncbi:MAG: hypothetical protein IK064_01465, partial [Clostridia bacterium]|nr:hypothetical protein [Clostridia bacterium]
MKIGCSLRCHIGRCRHINQDNFLLGGRFLDPETGAEGASFDGRLGKLPQLAGVFDGLGGEDRGEIAAYIAAREFGRAGRLRSPADELKRLCRQVNRCILDHTGEHGEL